MPVFPIGMTEDQYLQNLAINDGMAMIEQMAQDETKEGETPPYYTYEPMQTSLFVGRVYGVVASHNGKRLAANVRYTDGEIKRLLQPFRAKAKEMQDLIRSQQRAEAYRFSRKYHGGIINISNGLLKALVGQDILALADTQGKLREHGIFGIVKRALLLPDSYTIEGMFYHFRDDIWHVRVSSPELPWVPDGQTAPTLWPRYTYSEGENGAPKLIEVRVEGQQHEERLEVAPQEPSAITFEDANAFLVYCVERNLPFWLDWLDGDDGASIVFQKADFPGAGKAGGQ